MTCTCRDYQRSKVYAWEDNLSNGRRLSFAEIPAYVARIWAAAGLKWPPLVEMLHKNDIHAGKATRGIVWFRAGGATEQTILHELAHSMTSTIHDHTDAHGPKFVGVYMHLMARHIGVPLPLAMYSAQKDGVKFDITATPWCGR